MYRRHGMSFIKKSFKKLLVFVSGVFLAAASWKELNVKAGEVSDGYRIYSESERIEVMEAVDIYWEENGEYPIYLIAEYNGKPVWKMNMETEKECRRLRMAFDREGRWMLYFLIKEDGDIKSGRDRAGNLEILVTNKGKEFLEWHPKIMDYGGSMYYFSWEGGLIDGVQVKVSKDKKGEYREVGSIEGESFWLKVKGRKYIKLCPFVLINGNKFYGQSKVFEVSQSQTMDSI